MFAYIDSDINTDVFQIHHMDTKNKHFKTSNKVYISTTNKD